MPSLPPMGTTSQHHRSWVVALSALSLLVGCGPRPAAAPSPEPEASVFDGARLYVDPASEAVRASARSNDPRTAALLRKVARGSTADWFGEEDPDGLAAEVAARVATIRQAGALPVLVAYNIPRRDCGSHSGGGAEDAD